MSDSTIPPLEAISAPPPQTHNAPSSSSAFAIASHHPSTNEMDLELQHEQSASSSSSLSSSVREAGDMNGNGGSHATDEDGMDSTSVDDNASALDSPHTHLDTDAAHDADDSSHLHSSSSPLPSPTASSSAPWIWDKRPERVVYLTEKLFHLENRKLRGYKLVPVSSLPSSYLLDDRQRKREVKPKQEAVLATPKPDGLKRRTSQAVSSSSPHEHEVKAKKEKSKSKASTSSSSASSSASHYQDSTIHQLQENHNQIAELQLKLAQLQQQQLSLQMLGLGALMQQPSILQSAGLPLAGLNPLLAQSLALGLQNPLLLANPALASAVAAATPTESKKQLKRKLSSQTPTLKRKNSMTESPPLSSAAAAPPLPTSIPTPIPMASATPTASKHGRSLKKHSLNTQLDPSFMPPALRKARGVIDNLMKHKLNVQGVFNVPVNHTDATKPYFASNYLELIAPYSPMDLGTVKTKLNTGEYNTLEELANDVRTIWRNAMHYNARDSWIHTNADQLGKLFEAEYIKLSQTPATTPTPKAKKPKRDKAPKSAKNEEHLREELAELNAKVSQGINDGVPAHELSHLHKRIHQIESELKASKESTKSAPSKKSRTATSTAAPVTKEEKKKLQQDIYAINESNPDVLDGVIDIIRKSVNISGEDEGKEVEIDIDSLSPNTVRELQNFVAEAMRKLMEGKPPGENKEQTENEEYQSSRAQSLMDSDDENMHDTLDDD